MSRNPLLDRETWFNLWKRELDSSCWIFYRYLQGHRMKLNYILPALLLALSACATSKPAEDAEDEPSGPTVYGQISLFTNR